MRRSLPVRKPSGCTEAQRDSELWLACILTRPLDASIGDFMSQHDDKYGGLGLGTTKTSYMFLAAILAFVAFLSLTKRDQTPPEVVIAETTQHPPQHHVHHARRHASHQHPSRLEPATQDEG
jgi:hypothetical protein